MNHLFDFYEFMKPFVQEGDLFKLPTPEGWDYWTREQIIAEFENNHYSEVVRENTLLREHLSKLVSLNK